MKPPYCDGNLPRLFQRLLGATVGAEAGSFVQCAQPSSCVHRLVCATKPPFTLRALVDSGLDVRVGGEEKTKRRKNI